MRDHPIPQDIVGYKFHIIGNMTLKQFAELAAGALMGLLVYSTNLPVILKWPLIAVAIGMGAAAAFLPIEERPLDHWLTTFIGVMYRPTKFFWRRSDRVPDVFSYSPDSNQKLTESMVDLTPARRDRIKEYLASVPEANGEVDIFTQQERAHLLEIMAAFDSVKIGQVSATPQAHKPNLTTRTRSLKNPNAAQAAADAVTVFDQKKRNPLLTKHQKTVEEVALNMAVPENVATRIEKEQLDTRKQAQAPEQTGAYVDSADITPAEDVVDGENVVFNVALPFPSRPTEVNKLVGMILTPTNELIPDAIVEVKDENNRVVRAVKSNALGQFFITTPLHSGNYSLAVEHDTYQFPTMQIALDDDIVDPIEIRSLG